MHFRRVGYMELEFQKSYCSKKTRKEKGGEKKSPKSDVLKA